MQGWNPWLLQKGRRILLPNDSIERVPEREVTRGYGFRASLVGSILVIANSILLAINPDLFRQLFGPIVYIFGLDLLERLLPIWVLLGAILLLSSIGLRTYQGRRKVLGFLILVVGLTSILAGGGFVFGSLCCAIGGFSAIKYSYWTEESRRGT